MPPVAQGKTPTRTGRADNTSSQSIDAFLRPINLQSLHSTLGSSLGCGGEQAGQDVAQQIHVPLEERGLLQKDTQVHRGAQEATGRFFRLSRIICCRCPTCLPRSWPALRLPGLLLNAVVLLLPQ